MEAVDREHGMATGKEASMNDEAMRRVLLEKLSDPRWKAQQARRYRQIMGETEIAFTAPPARLRESIPIMDMMPLPAEEVAGTLDALWMGNWQRSLGALTITRFPDDTVVLDYPGGERTLFQPCHAPRNRFSWQSETFDGAATRSEAYRCPDRFEDADEALLEMHHAALAMFIELAAAADG